MIKEVINKLNKEQFAQLMTAFEGGFGQIIRLPNGKFVGVNISNMDSVIIIEEAGDWYYGEMKDAGKN